MPFKNIIAKSILLVITLCGLSSAALAQDQFIFRYSFVPIAVGSILGSASITLNYSDGTSEVIVEPGLDKPVSGQMILTKEVRTVKGNVNYNTKGCKIAFSGTANTGPYGYEVSNLPLPNQSGSSCADLPSESEIIISMSLLPVITIVNADPARANPTNNIYCDNEPVRLLVNYFSHQLEGAYWQYRVDNGPYYPLKYNTPGGVWDATNNIQGNDISFTLQDIFGANYPQYLNRRIEFRAVHAQQFSSQRHVDQPNQGSNSFTYFFYPSTAQPVNVKAIDPLCSDGNTFGVDIQFNRALIPAEVISSIVIRTKVGDYTVDQYPRSEFDPRITLDASNTFHFSGTLNPGDYYLTIEGYYPDPAHPQCNKKFYDFSIHAPKPVSFAVDDKKDVGCFGEATGTIALKGDGGTGVYAYSLDNGANWSASSNFTGLAKGRYTIIARDGNGCPAAASQTVTINEPTAALTAGVTGYSDPAGATKSDGSISIEVNGGSLPYTYLWNNGATTQNLSGLGGGTYTVTVTDAHKCTATIDSLALVSPPAIAISFKETPVSCHGLSDGGIEATVSGGKKPYTYSWSNGNNATKLTGLTAGRYTLLITDANKVEFSKYCDLGEPGALKIAPTVTKVTCNSKTDGAISTEVTGGTTPYTYRWSNGATTPDISQLPAGNYHLSVTDARNCPVAMDTAVTEPAKLAVSGTITPPSRFGDSDAKIDATVSGGTTPYTYAWSNGATIEDLDALAEADYILDITDKNNCTSSETFKVRQPARLVASIATNSIVKCHGSNTGAITADVSGE